MAHCEGGLFTMSTRLCVLGVFLLLVSLSSTQDDGFTDENRPYEFGFNIEGYQHRHEKKDEKGIIMGEFGFITADGVYHITVYATDENGNFKILKMKNIKIGLPMEKSTTPAPTTQRSYQAVQTPPSTQQSAFKGVEGCSGCLIPTTAPPSPSQPTGGSFQGNQGNRQTQNPPSYGTNPFAPKVSGIPPVNSPTPPNQTPGLGQTPGFGSTNLNQPSLNQNKNQFQAVSNPGGNYGKQGSNNELKNQQNINGNNQPNQQYPGKSNIPQPPGQFPNGGGNTQGFPSPSLSATPPSSNNAKLAQGQKYGMTVKEMVDQINGVKGNSSPGATFPGDGMSLGDLIGMLYKFNYTLSFHGHHETGDSAGNKEGGYFFNGRDGFARDVKYIANEFGYQPNITLKDLGLESPDTPKEETEKELTQLKGNEFIWFYKR